MATAMARLIVAALATRSPPVRGQPAYHMVPPVGGLMQSCDYDPTRTATPSSSVLLGVSSGFVGFAVCGAAYFAMQPHVTVKVWTLSVASSRQIASSCMEMRQLVHRTGQSCPRALRIASWSAQAGKQPSIPKAWLQGKVQMDLSPSPPTRPH